MKSDARAFVAGTSISIGGMLHIELKMLLIRIFNIYVQNLNQYFSSLRFIIFSTIACHF